ncbi:LSU ribosomal protein L18p (L5e) [hydrothermal vent metagenome]|uniref:LSU ribosomal protein L18p (L5e) n=1 Tax=hydrothermal vent metagenome TaxID=652676 RepID=A0A3B0W995_9ZZZZ
MARTDNKIVARQKRVRRIRKKVVGTSERPRLRVYKSSKHIYAQIIDDTKGHTLASASSMVKEITEADIAGKVDKANRVGILLAAMAKANGIEKVVFDRGGYIYHGRVKALSEGAREGGLVF